MPRKRLLRSSVHPYHVVARSNNREWFTLDGEELWSIFSRLVSQVSEDYGARFHAFVMMSNHFHAVLTTPNSNLDRVMQYLMRESTKSINRSSGRTNHLFGGPYKWNLISEERQYFFVLKYVFRNPIRAGICSLVEEYPWSSVRSFLSNSSDSALATQSAFLRPPKLEVLRNWLNEGLSSEQEKCIKGGLRRREFEFPVERTSRKVPACITKSDAIPFGD